MANNFSVWNNLTTANLAASGALNLGQAAVAQTSSNTTSVSCSSSSGVITTHGAINTWVTATFTVSNPNVTANSVVLATAGEVAQSGLDSGTYYTANVANQANGSFQLNITNAGSSNSTHSVSCGYLICWFCLKQQSCNKSTFFTTLSSVDRERRWMRWMIFSL